MTADQEFCIRCERDDGYLKSFEPHILADAVTTLLFLPRDTLCAKRGLEIACRLSVRLSVCLSVTLVDHDHRLKILETNCANN